MAKAAAGGAASSGAGGGGTQLPKATCNVRYPIMPGIRGGPPLLPLPRIPTGFVTPAPLERNKTKTPRKWVRQTREILSLGGRVWTPNTWLSHEAPTWAPANAAPAAASTAAATSTAPAAASTPAQAATVAAPSPLRAPPASSPLNPKVLAAAKQETDWRGSSPAFVASRQT